MNWIKWLFQGFDSYDFFMGIVIIVIMCRIDRLKKKIEILQKQIGE